MSLPARGYVQLLTTEHCGSVHYITIGDSRLLTAAGLTRSPLYLIRDAASRCGLSRVGYFIPLNGRRPLNEHPPNRVKHSKRRWEYLGHPLRNPKTNVNRRVLKWNPKCNRKDVSCNCGGYSIFHSTVMRASLIVQTKWMRVRILSVLFQLLVVFQWEGFVVSFGSSFRGHSLGT